ncbi:MAG TPA: hypothetical protein VK992_04615, partial [Candidatus Caenarcaniphilales bacterium]|nr:hypothetical protein [Candidatus Caenarcaniphilales bacterium]
MSSAPSPVVAALLSLVFPGVGQIYAGQVRRGLFLALPVVVLVVFVFSVVLAGPAQLALDLIESTPAMVALLVVLVLFFLYHVAAIVDAHRVARAAARQRPAAGNASSSFLVVLLALPVLLYGTLGYLGARTTFLLDHVRDPGSVLPSPSF